jgi:hypothetical protein
MGVRHPADLPAAPAVYAIGTVANGRVYVGGSLNARRRVEHHRYILRQGEHRNGYLQRAFDRHGKAALALSCSNRACN